MQVHWFMFEMLKKCIDIGHHVQRKRTLLLLDFNKNWKVLINCSKHFPTWNFNKICKRSSICYMQTDRQIDRSKIRAQFWTLSLQTLQTALTLPDVKNLREGFSCSNESLALEMYAVSSLQKIYFLFIQFCSSHNWNMVHGIWWKGFVSCHLSSWK